MYSPTGDVDYDNASVPSMFTIQREQEEMCFNITIKDDALIETNETFTLSLSTVSTNFSAGVLLTPESTTIKIVDNDGECIIITVSICTKYYYLSM